MGGCARNEISAWSKPSEEESALFLDTLVDSNQSFVRNAGGERLFYLKTAGKESSIIGLSIVPTTVYAFSDLRGEVPQVVARLHEGDLMLRANEGENRIAVLSASRDSFRQYLGKMAERLQGRIVNFQGVPEPSAYYQEELGTLSRVVDLAERVRKGRPLQEADLYGLFGQQPTDRRPDDRPGKVA